MQPILYHCYAKLKLRINKFQPTLLAKFCIHNFAMRCRQRQALNGSLQLSVRLLKNKQDWDAFCVPLRCGFYLSEQFVETPGLPPGTLFYMIVFGGGWGDEENVYTSSFKICFWTLKEKCSRNWGSFAISPSLKFPIIGFIMRCSTLLFTTRRPPRSPRRKLRVFHQTKIGALNSSFPYSTQSGSTLNTLPNFIQLYAAYECILKLFSKVTTLLRYLICFIYLVWIDKNNIPIF